MEGYEIKFNIYANNEAEVEKARQALVGFIADNARQGRAVSANKITQAVARWQDNPFVKQQIINFFS